MEEFQAEILARHRSRNPYDTLQVSMHPNVFFSEDDPIAGYPAFLTSGIFLGSRGLILTKIAI